MSMTTRDTLVAKKGIRPRSDSEVFPKIKNTLMFGAFLSFIFSARFSREASGRRREAPAEKNSKPSLSR